MSAPAIYWFKNDLRLHDNEGLINAITNGSPILPVYIFDPFLYRKVNLGFTKTDAVRFDFINQCVADLRKNLKAIGGNLKVVVGNPSKIIPRIAKEYKCEAIYAEDEFATEELILLKAFRKNLPENCKLHLTWGRTLYHIDDLPYKIPEIPLTSKAFRINTQKATEVRKTFPKIEQLTVFEIVDWGELPSPEEVGLNETKNYQETYVKGGETEALKRLDYYLFETEQLTSYRWTRNRSMGMEYSSKFSPYMALGCLSPRAIYEAVKKYEKEIKKNQSTWWLIFEVVWRDYFTFKLMRFQNQVYQTEGYVNKKIEFTDDNELFKRWCEGQTGIPFIDAHMRELNATGFMSNRGRVNCASFLVHDYLVDWTWGAAYFESKLIDYDVGSNWMNWHAQAYQIWYTNPVHQANKYNTQEFIRRWVPELRELNDTDILIPWETLQAEYPKPHTVFKKWTRAVNKIKAGTK